MTDERSKAACYKLMPVEGGEHAARTGAVEYAVARLGFTDPEVESVYPMGPWLHVKVLGYTPVNDGTLAENLTESRMPRKRRIRRKR